jgi:hypothetical protein
MSERRLGLVQFKKLSIEAQTKMLSEIESALTYSIRRGVTPTDLEQEASEKLSVSLTVVKLVSQGRKFKTKLQSRMM